MVKDVILSRSFQPELILNTGSNRRITGGPLYAVSDVVAVSSAQTLRVATRKAVSNIRELPLSYEELTQLIQRAVQGGRYRNSEWCELGRTDTTVSWAACDAYTLKVDEWNEAAGKFFPTEYYLKFAIGKTGLMLLVVSCHL